MIGIAEAAQAAPETWLDSLGPLVALASLLWGGWQTIRAARKAALLRAAIVGVRAGLDALAHEDAEAVKGAIKSAAGPLEPALKAEVRKTTSSMPAYREPPVLGALLVAASLVLLPSCVAAESKHAAERLAATARVIEAAAAHHADIAVLPPEEARAALAGFASLAAEHRGYAEDLVAATGGDPAEVDRLEAEWRARASERARARREAVVTATAVSGTAVPR